MLLPPNNSLGSPEGEPQQDAVTGVGDLPRYVFGPFELGPRERTLKKDGVHLRLSDKPLDILINLVARAGELVSKEELLSSVWSGVTVGEGSLRVHIVALRKALGETAGEARYIVNVAGRGYQFIAPVSEIRPGETASEEPAPVVEPLHPQRDRARPPRSDTIIGRDDIIERLSAQVSSRRLTTIVGPGGVGKSTVALSVAERLRGRFDDIRFLDLAPLNEAQLLPMSLALVFDVRVTSDDVIAALTHAVEGRRILLVLDGCEHLIETTALIIERLLEGLPELQVMATSREPMRLSHERVYRLSPLGAAPLDVAGADALMDYPAPQLFVERALAAWQDFELNDANAQTISRICHALDGLPLAIELAVGQLPFLGLEDLARSLIDPLPILGRGRRTAAPRQRTLRATLDWSHDLLSLDERTTLRRLGVFRGRFDLDAATAIATCPKLPSGRILDAMAGLVAKSIVSVDYAENIAVYKLLDTTRAYARSRLEQANEWNAASKLHAQYVMDRLSASGPDMRGQIVMLKVRDSEIVDDIRAALAWVFSQGSETKFARDLTIAVTFILAQRSSLQEARIYLQRALDRLNPEERGTLDEFNLRLYINTTSPISGASDENLSKLLALATQLGEPAHIARALELAYLTRLRVSDYMAASEAADRLGVVLAERGSSIPRFSVEWMKGVAAHFLGDYGRAEAEFRNILAAEFDPETIRFSGHPIIYAHCFLSRVLWATGREQEALAEAERALAQLPSSNNPMISCTVVVWLCQLWFWAGDLDRVAALSAQMREIGQAHALDTQQVLANVWEARVLIARGQPAEMLPRLEEHRRHLADDQQDMLTPIVHTAFAEALAAIGDVDRALKEIDEGLAHVARSQADIFLPEMLLVKARILAGHHDEGVRQDFVPYESAIEASSRRGAAFWEARGVRELLRHAVATGRMEIALATLARIGIHPEEYGGSVSSSRSRHAIDMLMTSRAG